MNGQTADKYFVGGIGTALGQVFRNNFPTQGLATGIQLQAYDRVAEADYAIDQLSLRQQQLGVAKTLNQAQVDIANSLVALSQARSRYEAAVQNRILQQQLYDAEQKKFAAGESTTYNVTQQQRDLINGQSAELSAQVSWQTAKLSLDQNIGATLEANHVRSKMPKREKLRALAASCHTSIPKVNQPFHSCTAVRSTEPENAVFSRV